MPDQLVAEYISTIYKYRGLLPFDNSESLSRREIANWSDEALAKYFVYVLRREQNICKILEESKQKNLKAEIELSDTLEQYLVDTNEIDNGPDEEPTLDTDDFLGAKEPNERTMKLSHRRWKLSNLWADIYGSFKASFFDIFIFFLK